MHKRLYTAIFVAILAFSLTTNSAGATTLQLLHCWGEQRATWVEEMAASFSAAHPGISVEVQLVGCGNALHEAFLTAYAGGAPPDVVMIHTLNVPATADMGGLTPLNSFLEKESIPLTTWYPSEIESANWQGQIYGLPIRTGGDANTLLYYNKELFRAAGLDDSRPPATWSELDEVSRNLIRYEGDQLVQAAVTLHGGDHSPLAWLGTGGAELLSSDGKTVLFGETAAVQTAQYARDHFAGLYRGGLAELNAFLSSQGGARAAFPWGRLAMQYNGSWEHSYIMTTNPDTDFGMALRPSRERDGRPGTHAGTFLYAVPGGVPNPDAAWELVKWLTLREETAGHFMLRQARPSPVIAFNSNPEYLELNPDWHVIGEALGRAARLPVLPISNEVIGIFNAAFNAAANDAQAPHIALPEAAERAQAVVDQYWSRE